MTAAALPLLRQDLEFFDSAPQADGSPAWTIQDKVRNCFFRIGWAEFQILSRWGVSADRIVHRVNTETTLRISSGTVQEILKFLMVNQLVQAAGEDGSLRLRMQKDAGKMPAWKKLFHQSLCFQIPLVYPNGFLKATLPMVRPFFSVSFFVFMTVLALLSFYLISQQLTAFRSTFLYFFSFSGILAYGAAIIFAKVIHELGHAYATVLYGCRVPSMGITFMMGCPLLYTNTTETWRLPSRRQRFVVAVSGIAVELALAVFASLLWVFLPDGMLRSACFLLATSGWIMTVLINLNPLMRFDGYYLLSDLWGIENLRERSDRMALWQVREFLFGYGLKPPENVSGRTRTGLILYAFCSWGYRFLLFLGISIALYQFAFKALGILLFVYSLFSFILKPVVKELSVWQRNSHMISNKKARLTAFICAVVVLSVFIFCPVMTSVTIPAFYQDAGKTGIYAPVPAKVLSVNVSEGQKVDAKTELARLFSSDLLIRHKRNEAVIQSIRWELEHGTMSDGTNRQVLQNRLAEAMAVREGFRQEGEQLVLRAPYEGTVREISENLKAGEWVNPYQRLFLISGEKRCTVIGFVPEKELYRLKNGQKVLFYPAVAGASVRTGTVSSIENMPLSRLGEAEILASDVGGSLPVRRRGQGEAVVQGSYYKVHIALNECEAENAFHLTRGEAKITASGESLWDGIKRQVLSVLLRESSL